MRDIGEILPKNMKNPQKKTKVVVFPITPRHRTPNM
jgi:hypothetical protein